MSISSNFDNFTFKHVSLGGKREPISCAELLSNVNHFCSSVSPALSKNEESELRVGLETLAIDRINAKFQTTIRLNTPPEERVFVRMAERTGTGIFTQDMHTSRFIYERDEMQFDDAIEKLGWQPRIAMIEEAFTSHSIFSLSIVPTDPTIAQTWYDKKSVCPAEPISPVDEKLLKELFGELPVETDPSIASKWKMREVTSSKKASQIHPSPTLTGFFSPFSTFSSELAAPQYDPQHLPDSVITAHAFSEEEVEAAIKTFESCALKTKIKNIVDSFAEDIHSQGIGLLVLQYPTVKVLYLTK